MTKKALTTAQAARYWLDMGIEHFTPQEFDSPDLPGSGANMNFDFVNQLDEIRDCVGRPLLVNSGYRTKSYNRKVGGAENSLHLIGCAVDIHCVSHIIRYDLVSGAIATGMDEIIIYPHHVHLARYERLTIRKELMAIPG